MSLSFSAADQEELIIAKGSESPWLPSTEWGVYYVGPSRFTFTESR